MYKNKAITEVEIFENSIEIRTKSIILKKDSNLYLKKLQSIENRAYLFNLKIHCILM